MNIKHTFGTQLKGVEKTNHTCSFRLKQMNLKNNNKPFEDNGNVPIRTFFATNNPVSTNVNNIIYGTHKFNLALLGIQFKESEARVNISFYQDVSLRCVNLSQEMQYDSAPFSPVHNSIEYRHTTYLNFHSETTVDIQRRRHKLTTPNQLVLVLVSNFYQQRRTTLN